MFSLKSPHRGYSNEYKQYTILNIKQENHPKLSQICSYGFFPRDLGANSTKFGKRAISVPAIHCKNRRRFYGKIPGPGCSKLTTSLVKDGLPYLFHSFKNKYFNKISLGNMLYFQNKL